MSSLILTGDTSGQVTLAAAAVAGSNTITVQAATGTMSVNTLSTAVASTSGTSIDFTGLPSWVKRITVMFVGVSTSGIPFCCSLVEVVYVFLYFCVALLPVVHEEFSHVPDHAHPFEFLDLHTSEKIISPFT